MIWDRADVGGIDWSDPVERDHPLTAGLVSWWLPLPGWNSGLRLPNVLALGDNGARANHGTLSNSPSWAPGTNGFGAIRTAGVGGAGGTEPHVRATTAAGLPVGATDTFTLWYAHRTRTYKSLSSPFGFGTQPNITDPTNGAVRAVLQFGGSGNYYFWGVNTDWNTGIAYDIDNLPHSAAFTGNGGSPATIGFYRDGVSRGSTTLGSSFIAAGSNIWANSKHSSGTEPDGDFLGGLIFNRVLSAGELALLDSEFRRGYPTLLRRVRSWSFGVDAGGGGGGNRRRRVILCGSR